MSDHVNTKRTPEAPEKAEARGRKVNNRYIVTFSVVDYAVLREWVEGSKSVRTAEVKAILRQRMHHHE